MKRADAQGKVRLNPNQALYFALAESVLEESSSEEGGEEEVSLSPARVRALLQSELFRFRRRKLVAAQIAYREAVQAFRERKSILPTTAEARRELLATVFRDFPQMHQAFLTVQHREFRELSDSDIESFLRQLQDLQVLPLEVSSQRELLRSWRALHPPRTMKLATDSTDLNQSEEE